MFSDVNYEVLLIVDVMLKITGVLFDFYQDKRGYDDMVFPNRGTMPIAIKHVNRSYKFLLNMHKCYRLNISSNILIKTGNICLN